MKKISIICLSLVFSINCFAQKTDKNKEVLMSFYEKALTVNKETTPTKVMQEILAENYISYDSKENKGKAASIGIFEYLWKLIPGMKWEPKEIIKEGNKYVVRSMASGTPNGDFFGLPTNGSKSFHVMTIDILTIENGKILTAYHVEDWATAMGQLK